MRYLLTGIVCIFFTSISYAQQKTISGKVIDGITGQPLVSASLYLLETKVTIASDINGKFSFTKLITGMYTVKCSYTGYTEKIVEEIMVNDSTENFEIVISLNRKSDLDNVVVSSTRTKAAGETVSSLLIAQKNNITVSDGVSAEFIKKTPDKNTSDVLKRISGASIQDDRFVVVRGLNDRYNASFINGAPLPSTESDRKAFAFDILPSVILDNLVIYKTAAADKTGEFAGGIIDVTTKSTSPKNFTLINAGFTNNSLATGKTRFFSENNGNKDWLGMDDGTRKMPVGLPSVSVLRNDLNSQQKGELAKLFNKFKWGVLQEITRPGYNLQLSKSLRINKKGEEFISSLFSVNYNHNFTFNSGSRNSYDFAIQDSAQESFQRAKYQDSIYNDEIIIALMGNMAVKINSRNTFTWKNLFSINTDNKLIKRFGSPDYDADSASIISETVRSYTTNKIFSSQMAGNHLFSVHKTRVNWLLSYSTVNREIPNLSRTAYSGRLPDKNDLVATFVTPPNQTSGSGTMFSSNSDEQIYYYSADASQPYNLFKKMQSTSKIGIAFQSRKRDFTSRVLGFTPYSNGAVFDNTLTSIPEDQIFLPEHMGLMSNGKGGFILSDGTLSNANYNASSKIWSSFIMNEHRAFKKLRLNYGIRFESFNQKLNSIKNLRDTINLDSTVIDLLPSANFIYSLNSKTNIRLSYSQTLNRPEFRELAPFLFFDYVSNYTFEGQPDLKRTKISNYDFRFEYYPGKAQIFSLTGFYKKFVNPIEILSLPNTTNQAIYANAASATVYGIETEFRLLISALLNRQEHPFLKKWTISGNFAYLKSAVVVDSFLSISASQLIKDRALQGQSPYIINGGISYNDEKSGFSSTLSVNRSGERIFIAGTFNTASIYERSRTVIDIQFGKYLFNKFLELKLTVKDLLNQDLNLYYDFDRSKTFTGKDRFYSTNKIPRVISVSAALKFEK